MRRFIHSRPLLGSLRFAFADVVKTGQKAPVKRENLQFSKAKLVDFGELPFGQVPEALKYSRPTKLTKLDNGIRVATETYPGHQSAIVVAIKAGSRQESLENSSVAQFAARGGLKGTKSYSKEQVEELVDKLGGALNVNVDREVTTYSLHFPQEHLSEAVKLMAEIILRPTFEAAQMEALKAEVYKGASSMDPFEVTSQSLHFTSYRDHFLGQPSTGIRENVYSITPEQIASFHSKFYVGRNIVVSSAGQIDANALTQLVSAEFGQANGQTPSEVPNSDQPYYTPSLLFQRDDELYNTGVAAGFLAPSWNDPDFFAMELMQRLIGSYRVDKHTGAHLNTSHQQYNSFHTYLGSFPDIIMHEPHYKAYSDTGLFFNFLYGNELFNREMLLISQQKLTSWAQQINVAEVFRARNKYWNDLLDLDDPVKVAEQHSQSVAYLDRTISRTERATRITNMDSKYISRLASKWFWDKEIAVTAWGNLHNVNSMAHYNRPYRRSTLGDYTLVDVFHG